MIHHLSIAARDPKRVAEVLAELMDGTAKQPNAERYPSVWNAHQNDRDGTLIEVVPAGVELLPKSAGGPRLVEAPQYGPFHFAMSVEMSPEAITAIAGSVSALRACQVFDQIDRRLQSRRARDFRRKLA